MHRRIPILIPGAIALIAGLRIGLVRMEWPLIFGVPVVLADHGPLMVSGFLGTLIGLERAVGTGCVFRRCGSPNPKDADRLDRAMRIARSRGRWSAGSADPDPHRSEATLVTSFL
jgi:hypothetical protein